MPLRNRVTPFGAIISTPAHGTLMGNRGILHNDQKEITRIHNGKRWVTCTLVGKPNVPKRPLMEPGHYTALFFLDEATALAAGHRPCATCRRKEYDEFLRIWSVANGATPEGTPAIKRLDDILQRERVQRGGPKPSHEENFDTLPDGSMVDMDGSAFLVKGPSSVDSRGLQREGRATGADNGDCHYVEVHRKLPAGRLRTAVARISARFGSVTFTQCLVPSAEDWVPGTKRSARTRGSACRI